MVRYDLRSYIGVKLTVLGENKENQSLFRLAMSEDHKRQPRFAICIKADVDDMLTVRKIYQGLPDPSAAESGFIRSSMTKAKITFIPPAALSSSTFPQKYNKLWNVFLR